MQGLKLDDRRLKVHFVEACLSLVEEGDGNWDQNGHLKLGDLAAELDGNSVGRQGTCSQ